MAPMNSIAKPIAIFTPSYLRRLPDGSTPVPQQPKDLDRTVVDLPVEAATTALLRSNPAPRWRFAAVYSTATL